MSAVSKPQRRERARLAAAAAALFTITPAAARAACELKLAETPRPIRIAYDPFAVARAAGAFDLALENPGDEPCEVQVVVTDAADTPMSSVRLDGVEVEFRNRRDGEALKDAAHPGVFTFTAAAGAALRAELDAAVVRDAVAEAGEHAADIYLTVRRPDGSAYLPRIPLTLTLAATPRAQINIAGAAGAFGSTGTVEQVDFGVAVTGAVKRTFLQMRANSKMKITMQSEHGGVMRHVELKDAVPPVRYTVSLDGAPLDLSQAAVREFDPPRTIEGVSAAMDFTLGDVVGQMSGEYRDLITIDVAPS